MPNPSSEGSAPPPLDEPAPEPGRIEDLYEFALAGLAGALERRRARRGME